MKGIEIPFGAKDSELCGWEYKIPEGMEAVVENGKVIVRKKESEDERIRKAALEGIEYLEHKLGWDFIGDTDILNVKEYLERQKEQPMSAEEVLIRAGLKPYRDGNQWCVLAGGNIQKGICGFGDTIDEALYQFLMEVLKIQKEQKPLSTEETERNSIAFLEQLGYTCIPPGAEQKPAEWSEDIIRKAVKEVGLTQHQIDWFKTNVFPPKQEWNEEDEIRKEGCVRYLANLRDAIEFNQHIGDNARKSGKKEIQKGIDWLKNLSERFNLLPKQEWSEEDYNAILIAIDWLQYYRDTFVATGEAKDEITDCVNRLESLRPQPHWKPSEEQMEVFKQSIEWNDDIADEFDKTLLQSLYNNLKDYFKI